MKNILKTIIFSLILIILTSCSSIKVTTDYDRNVDFNEYKTFAFFKTGIDRAEINDLDKRRILRAIEAELLAKGFTKSEKPDFLVSLFTKSQQRVDVYNNAWGWGPGWGGWGWGPGWGWGMGPGWGMNQPSVSTSTQGYLYIDFIDPEKKELLWQGMGSGYLTRKMDKKEARIKEFVETILEEYPPQLKK